MQPFQARHGLLVDGQVGPHTWSGAASGRRRMQKHQQAPSKHHRRHRDGMLQLGVRRAAGRQAAAAAAHPREPAVRPPHVAGGARLPAPPRPAGRRRGRPRRPGPLSHRGSGRAAASPAARSPSERCASRASTAASVRVGRLDARGFDCSGLIWYAYRRLGVEIPRVTYGQWEIGRHVPPQAAAARRPGLLPPARPCRALDGPRLVPARAATGQVVHASQMRGLVRRRTTTAPSASAEPLRSSRAARSRAPAGAPTGRRGTARPRCRRGRRR